MAREKKRGKKARGKPAKKIQRSPNPALKAWVVKGSEAPILLGNYLRDKLPGMLSSRDIKNLLERSLCRINGDTERFASYRLRPGQRVSFLLPEDSELRRFQPERISSKNVLYQDDHCLILDKPPGYSATPNKSGPGLPEVLRGFADDIGVAKLLLVHRLDRDTSGALLLAKDGNSQRLFFDMFRERQVKKAYEAIVHGQMSANKGTFRSKMARMGEEGGQARWASANHGQEAVTEYHVLASDKTSSHLRLFPKTGRTHQLRVHLSEAGHPILGDGFYGRSAQMSCQKTPRRHLLHARGLIFMQPISKRQVAIESPLPVDFLSCLPKSESHQQS
jgi:RluA family pseudouridine synthase